MEEVVTRFTVCCLEKVLYGERPPSELFAKAPKIWLKSTNPWYYVFSDKVVGDRSNSLPL